VWLDLNHSCPRACHRAAVVVLPSRALLEVQPLLIDLAAAAAGAMSGSSSSSGEDEESDAGQQCGVPADNSAAAAVPELLQQGVAVGMSQPSDSKWCRVLLQLQYAGSSSTHDVESHAKQAAAAGKWLAAYCSPVCGAGGQPGQPRTQVASLRCWYDAKLQGGAHSDGGWADLLLSELPSEVAGQLVRGVLQRKAQSLLVPDRAVGSEVAGRTRPWQPIAPLGAWSDGYLVFCGNAFGPGLQRSLFPL
jgi:hypothetical protein